MITSSKLTIKTPQQRQWRHSGVFIVNFVTPGSSVSIVDVKPVNGKPVISKAQAICLIYGQLLAPGKLF